MKSFILSLFLLVNSLFFAQIISKEDSATVHRESEMNKRLQEILKYRKELCAKDSLIAVHDAKTENKYFINNIAPNGSNFPANKELEISLKKLGIFWGGTWIGNCLGTYTPNSCYYRFMNNFTEQKFGKDIIDHLVRQSLLDYIDKKPSIIFEYNDHLDWLYENNEAMADDIINRLFFKKFVYPNGYKKSANDNKSFTKVYLTFDEMSKRLKLDHFEHQITDPRNQKYISYLERNLRDFINSPIFVLSENAGRQNGVKTSFIIYYK